MTVFQETIRDRKALVPSARKRVNGSKTRFVGLPHDNLSPAQLKKLNGKVEVYNMHKPMTWEQFKSLPDDLSQQYIAYLENEFHISTGALATAFGVTSPPLRAQIEKKNISFHSSKRMTKEDMAAFDSFWNGVQAVTVVNPIEFQQPEDDDVSNQQSSPMKMTSFSLNYDGHFNPKDLMQTLILMIGEDSDCHIRIEVTK